jgi:5'-3' exonuclease
LLLKYKGVEADDIAAYITNKSKEFGIKVWLASSDKDWNLLIDDNVSQFSYVTRKEYTKDNWNQHYEFSVEDYISIKCLQGDKGDSVKGIDGVGPKRAQQLVEQYGSALDIYDALPINSKYVYIKKLNEQPELIILNYRLMDLRSFCEEAIGEDNLKDLKSRLEEFIGV